MHNFTTEAATYTSCDIKPQFLMNPIHQALLREIPAS